MKKIKILISLMLLIFTGIGVAIGYFLTDMMCEEYSGIATVIERRSASEVIVELNEEPDINIKNELTINSNIFAVNDNIKIDYCKTGSKYTISKVEAFTESAQEKAYIASRISNDPTMIKYKVLVSGKMHSEISGFSEILAMPTKLSNQEFKLISEEEYYDIKFYNTDYAPLIIPEGVEATLTLLENFNVISVENITSSTRTELPFTFTKRSVSFTGIGNGIYSVNLSFKNGDVINYFFK